MQQRRGRWQQVVVGGALAWAASATATQLYVGLPNGRTQAYARDGSGWSRVSRFDPPDVGTGATPAFGDLDGDGDLDAAIGNAIGQLEAFENTGSTGAPTWVRRSDWDPASPSAGGIVAPVLVDLDGDGDPDLLVGTPDGHLRGYQHATTGTLWFRHPSWDLLNVGLEPRPAVADINHDGRTDLLVGLQDGRLVAFAGTGSATIPFVRRIDWDPPRQAQRIAPALADLDGDGGVDILLGDGNATMTVLRNAGAAWESHPDWAPADPGSGPAVPVLLGANFGDAAPPPRGTTDDDTPAAELSATPRRGRAPLTVAFDATGSSDPNGDALQFAWDFGDGTPTAAATTATAVDPGAAIQAAAKAYNAAKNTRDAGHYPEAVTQYLAVVTDLLPLVDVTASGPVSAKGVKQIGRVARWYLQKIAHDLGGVYLWHSLGLGNCDRYGTSLQYSRESATQAVAGGFPDLPSLNGTSWNIDKATGKLQSSGCAIPDPKAMFGSGRAGGGTDGGTGGGTGNPGPGSSDGTGLKSHTFVVPGRYTATVTVGDGTNTAQASVTIVVNDPADPTPPDDPGTPDPGDPGTPPVDPGSDPYEGFGANTPGGTGGSVIHVTEASDAAVRAAFKQAANGHAILTFDVAGPIEILSPLPQLTGAFITVEGNGATLFGPRITRTAAMVDVRGHDVIVRNLRLRNGGDNIRAQGNGAYNIVFSHISSTGSGDDGISIGYGAHDVTVQYCLLAGNTRSIFMKYGDTTRVSIHHSWLMKQWIRGPLVSGSVLADIRNVIVEDWAMWGTRFEADASGNVVNSLFTLGKYARSIGGKPASALRLEQSGPVFTAGNSVGGLAVDPAEGAEQTPVDAPPVTTLSVGEMTDFVHGHAGALPRDAVDNAYIATGDGWHIGKYEPFRIDP